MDSGNAHDAADTYDGPWKAGMDSFFPEMMELLFPAAWSEIDWSQPFVSLNSELHSLQPAENNAGGRVADALYQVFRLGGSEQWLVFHIEVQSTTSSSLAKRMFDYLCRCWQKYDTEVLGFAVLGDLQPSHRPGPFGWQLGKGRLLYEFETSKLLDYRDRIAELEASSNPFALIILAHLYTKETRNDQERRRAFKLRLVFLLARRHYRRPQIDKIFEVIDWMMRLEVEQAIIFKQEVEALQEDNDMSAYVNTFQMVGRIEGRQEGRQEGLREGAHLGAERLLRTQLTRRFGNLPAWATDKLAAANAETLERWSLQLLEAGKLEEVFA